MSNLLAQPIGNDAALFHREDRADEAHALHAGGAVASPSGSAMCSSGMRAALLHRIRHQMHCVAADHEEIRAAFGQRRRCRRAARSLRPSARRLQTARSSPKSNEYISVFAECTPPSRFCISRLMSGNRQPRIPSSFRPACRLFSCASARFYRQHRARTQKPARAAAQRFRIRHAIDARRAEMALERGDHLFQRRFRMP